MMDNIPLWFAIAGAILATYGYLFLEFRATPTSETDLSAADVADGVGSREVTS